MIDPFIGGILSTCGVVAIFSVAKSLYTKYAARAEAASDLEFKVNNQRIDFQFEIDRLKSKISDQEETNKEFRESLENAGSVMGRLHQDVNQLADVAGCQFFDGDYTRRLVPKIKTGVKNIKGVK